MFISYPKRRDSLHFMVPFTQQTDTDGTFHLSSEECERTIALSRVFPAEPARIEGGADAREYRDTTTHFIPHNRDTNWLYHKLMTAAVEANDRYWQFDITGFFQNLQLLSYQGQCKQHYTWHLDIGPAADNGRKISLSVQLSAPTDYDGGELEFNSGKILTASKERGAVVLFPSFLLHRVAPVTRGQRWALVGWVQGQDHFR
jgi:PKHD-type hydroxylase